MHTQRTINVTAVISYGELVQAIKLLKPESIDMASIPDTGSDLTVTVGGRNVTLAYLRTAPTPNGG